MALCAFISMNAMEQKSSKGDAFLAITASINSYQACSPSELSRKIKKSIELGAPIEGQTLQSGMVVCPLLFAAQFLDPLLVEWLLAQGASRTVGSTEFASPLHALFSIRDSMEVSQQRLSQIIVWYQTKLPFTQEAIIIEQLTGHYPLITAAKNNNERLAQRCLEYGLNPNTQDERGRTALMYAVENKAYSVINLLLEYGVDASKTDTESRTAVDYAPQGFDEKLLSLIATLLSYKHAKVPLHHKGASPEEVKIAQELNSVNDELLKKFILETSVKDNPKKSKPPKRELLSEPAPNIVVVTSAVFNRPNLEAPTKQAKAKKKKTKYADQSWQ